MGAVILVGFAVFCCVVCFIMLYRKPDNYNEHYEEDDGQL